MLPSQLFQRGRIVVFVVGITRNHQFVPLVRYLVECPDEQVEPLLLDKPPYGQYIFMGLQPQRGYIVGRRGYGRSIHPVVNQVSIAAMVLLAQNIVDDGRDDNHLVGILDTHTFAQPQHSLGHPVPLLPVIVGTMVSHHHLQSQQPGKGDQQRRPDGVDMQHVGMHPAGIENSQECMDNGLDTLLAGCIGVFQANAFIRSDFVLRSHVARTAHHRHVVAHGSQAGIQLLAMGLYPTLNIGDSTSTGHDYLHRHESPSCPIRAY